MNKKKIKTMRIINETNIWCLEKISKIDTPLARLTRQKEKSLITRMRHVQILQITKGERNFMKNYINKFDDLRIYRYLKALLSPHIITKS